MLRIARGAWLHVPPASALDLQLANVWVQSFLLCCSLSVELSAIGSEVCFLPLQFQGQTKNSLVQKCLHVLIATTNILLVEYNVNSLFVLFPSYKMRTFSGFIFIIGLIGHLWNICKPFFVRQSLAIGCKALLSNSLEIALYK